MYYNYSMKKILWLLFINIVKNNYMTNNTNKEKEMQDIIGQCISKAINWIGSIINNLVFWFYIICTFIFYKIISFIYECCTGLILNKFINNDLKNLKNLKDLSNNQKECIENNTQNHQTLRHLSIILLFNEMNDTDIIHPIDV